MLGKQTTGGRVLEVRGKGVYNVGAEQGGEGRRSLKHIYYEVPREVGERSKMRCP